VPGKRDTSKRDDRRKRARHSVDKGSLHIEDWFAGRHLGGWFETWKNQWIDAADIWKSALTGKSKVSELLADSVAWSINGAAGLMLCCGPDRTELSFDECAEMAGPVEVNLPAFAGLGPVTPTDLILVGASGASPPAIPAAHVRVRVTGGAEKIADITLVNLFSVQPRLVPGEYRGFIELGGGRRMALSAIRS
jgi:hypothetical protein